MKLLCLTLTIMLAASTQAFAADIHGSRVTYGAPAPDRLPLALRTLSRRSASVLASDACWRGCTAQCGWQFQHCIRIDRLDACFAHNNQCDLACLKQCRLSGGPLVSWTDY
jgi:hypothetical protein